MYNEERKQEFINTHTQKNSTKKFMAQIFNWFEPYETEWGIDLSQQSAEILQPVVDKTSGLRSKSTELVLILLKEYVNWCGRNGYETSRGIYEVKINSIEKIKNQMVSSPIHLKRIIDRETPKETPVNTNKKEEKKFGFDKPERETVDITYRVFLWMAFAGLDDEDAIRVTADDVDLANLRINFEGHSYEIYKECIEDFEKACNLKSFIYEHPRYTIRRDRALGNCIMRGFRSSDIDLKSIRPIINRRLNPTEKDRDKFENLKQPFCKLSYKRIQLSGMFYRMYERERAGYTLNFSEEVASQINRKLEKDPNTYTTTDTRTMTTIANQIEREYLADYRKWKCAFAI